MPLRSLGIPMVVCAPSGTGKTTLVKRLLAEFPRFAFSVSYTTRPPRQGEADGKDYHFVDVEHFLQLESNNFFVEWAEVHGNYYGTPLRATMKLLNSGKDVLFDVDVQGVEQLKDKLSHALYVFIMPPSRQALVDRLKGRGSDTEEQMTLRLDNARNEMRFAYLFDRWIVNDDLEQAYLELKACLVSEGLSPRYRPRIMETILADWKE